MRRNKILCGIAIALLAAGAVAPTAIAQTQNQTVAIPPMPLKQALSEFAQRQHLQFVYVSEIASGVRTQGAPAGLSPGDTLQALLHGTGLQFRFLNANTVTISQAPETASPHAPASRRPQAESSADETTRLSTVTVTGSRLPASAAQGAQQVVVYTRQEIARSGQTTAAEFLNTLPVVSSTVTEGGFDTFGGAGTARLRGLPVGSTLVLLDGRVVEGSGANQSHGSPFDLNTIPVSAIERVEVVPEAASAVYGSDAIGGVINIILRKDLDGGQASIVAAGPTQGGYHDSTASLAWGKNFEGGNVTFVGSFQARGELSTAERDITANRDYRRFGGNDNRLTNCDPGNVYSADGGRLPGLSSSFAGIPQSNGSALTPANFVTTSGVLNKCSPASALVPKSKRGTELFNGYYDLTDKTQAFFQAMFSQVEQDAESTPATVSKVRVPAQNPYNPFGVPVLVDYAFNSEGPRKSAVGTQFFSRLLGGLKGLWIDHWNWEVAVWQSYDHTRYSETQFNTSALSTALSSADPTQSVNLFSSATPAWREVLNKIEFDNPGYTSSKLQTVNAFVRGTLLDLPSGAVDVVFGGEYNHERQSLFAPAEGMARPNTFSRNVRSVFAETRIPLLAATKDSVAGDRLTLTMAGRYDRYSDFGSKFTPEGGLEFRPVDTLLLRASYGKAFKAPDLRAVYASPSIVGPLAIAPDALRGGEIVNSTIEFGGNPNIRPQTGTSRTFGVVWSSDAVPDLQVGVSNFRVTQNNRIVLPNPSFLVQSPGAFPAELIVRAPPTVEDIAKGFPGKIVRIDARYINFGALIVEGNDLEVKYKLNTSAGVFTPSLALTNVYKYQSATPGASLQDRLGFASQDAFATRWKATAALDWASGPWFARLAGRHLSGYLDYDQSRQLGDYWLFDASAHYDFGKLFSNSGVLLRNGYADLSIINAFDRKPQFSNYFGSGFDPRQWDIRGRFVSFTLGTRW